MTPASDAGAERQFAAAWWALENGLIPEAVAMLRSAHAADPRHQPTARLVKTLDRLGAALHRPRDRRAVPCAGCLPARSSAAPTSCSSTSTTRARPAPGSTFWNG